MHLQQTKKKSLKSGGPQYYFHALHDHVKDFLRKRGACPVVLQTPYGIVASPFMAVDGKHKLENGKVVDGKVGHDRIQQGSGDQSIGEAIRDWYCLKPDRDFETIDIDVTIHKEGHFILSPLTVKMQDGSREQQLPQVNHPLSFHRDHKSKLWKDQIEQQRNHSASDIEWAAAQISRIVKEHNHADAKHILESDLLRASGALSLFGLNLSPYLGKGYDCVESVFQFKKFPSYPCPVEIKHRSRGFSYQIEKYTKLPRAVVLCMEHNLVNEPQDIDVIELPALAEYLSQ